MLLPAYRYNIDTKSKSFNPQMAFPIRYTYTCEYMTLLVSKKQDGSELVTRKNGGCLVLVAKRDDNISI